MIGEKCPNIIMVVLDAVRADFLSCYGHNRITTPNIDTISNYGTIFKETIANAPWTLPSIASIFTGLFPSEHGATQESPQLPPERITLPEILSKNNYHTAGFVTNPWLNKESNLMNGFKEFYLYSEAKSKKKKYMRKVLKSLHLKGLWSKCSSVEPGCSQDIIDEAILTLKRTYRNQAQPLFLYIHLMDAHLPYSPSRQYLRRLFPDETHTSLRLTKEDENNPPIPPLEKGGKGGFERPFSGEKGLIRRIREYPLLKDGFVHVRYNLGRELIPKEGLDLFRNSYEASILEMDDCVGNLYEFLRRSGLMKNSIIIITADHGENIGDHGLMDHQLCLYDTLLRVPLIIIGPEYFQGGQICTNQVQLHQIFHTIIDIIANNAGQIQEKYDPEKSLLKAVIDVSLKERYAFAEYDKPIQIKKGYLRYSSNLDDRFDTRLSCVRTREYKYISSENGKEEFYDLIRDPDELDNLISTGHRKISEMREQLKIWKSSLNLAINRSDEEHLSKDEKILSQLKALGYM